MNEVVKISRLWFQYNAERETILKDINISIYDGEWLSIIGHNGSGKSTLAKLINGLLMPTSGSIMVDNLLTTDDHTLWEIRRRVGYVFQNPDNQLVATTLRDEIAFGLENIGVEREEMVRRIEKSARKVGLLDFLDEEPYRLSGGQKQRLAIAGILAVEPKIMIFDEATSMPDPVGRREVLRTVKELNKNDKITVISITHDLNEAAMADRVIVLNKGNVVLEGTPREVFVKGEYLREIGLGLPITVQIYNQLKEEGVPFTKFCLDEDELVDELWKLT